MASSIAPSQGQQAANASDILFPVELRGKHILLATESLGPVNGVSRTTRSLIHYLRENGVHVAIVAPKFKGRGLNPNSSDDPEVRVSGYPLPYNPDLTVAYPLRLDRIYERSFQPDLIYLASPASVGFQFLLQIRQLSSPPRVLLNFQTDLSAYSEIIFPRPMDHFAVWLLRAVQGFLFNHKAVHTIFYPSSGVREYLEKAGAPSNKLVHLGRGVDTSLFDPSCRDEEYRKEIAPNGELILACVGRLAPEKGFEYLAQVARRLEEKNLSFKLLIVGGNRNPSVEEDVRGFFRELRDRVVFTGFLEGKLLARAYASADIFVHCSITETFGLVVLEAMACGLPVVARDCGGPSEIVVDQKSGYLIQPEDLDGFVGCVENLMRDSGLRQELARTAREIACDTTWKKINNKVALQLADALNTPTPPRKPSPIRNWISSHLVTFASSAVVMLRLNAAVGLICFMWMIAVLPLLVHGNSIFPSNWFRFFTMPTFRSLGSAISNWLKLKAR
ncbi:glycosyltransferase family 4 protein [Glonium stellatum]|uniref:Glycosyltransferase family 4 protein n=1 Tax=Glonium stellatum TaxID=574774 RepID=A0A8E2F4W5_9PEZI|nr:glycosyltransferase family 4 protein [Glonium stellatum]